MEFLGKGGRKPMLDIDVKLIDLDRENPRLVPYLSKDEKVNQDDLVKTLYDHFDSESVALSLVQNGYFDEEPVVLIPKNLPKSFDPDKFKNVDELTQEYKRLIEEEKLSFVVVEGNRRISAIKLIVGQKLRQKYSLDNIYPSTDDKNILYDITNIPAIIYPKREDVFTYLGIRHISGNLKWESFAQASYASDMIDHYVQMELPVKEAIKNVQKIIAHRSDKLVKQYVTYKLFKQAQEDLEFNVKPIVNKFSLLTVAYNSGAIRDYVGLPKYSKVDFGESLVDESKFEEFRNVLTWIYGDKSRNKNRVLTDSRKITSELSYVVKNPEAVKYLLNNEDLEGAYDRTSGEKEFLLKKIKSANRAIGTSLSFAFKYKGDSELIEQVEELKEIIFALESNIK